MGKASYYIAKITQVTGLGLVLIVWVVSVMQGGSMNFLFSFAGAGLALFMVGWMVQKLF
jgi:hypothetical protein